MSVQSAPQESTQPEAGRREVQPSSLFREEALQHYARSSEQGDLLRVSPSWAHRMYWVLLSLVITALAFSLIGRTSEYASGRAMVRFADRVDLTALTSGTCTALEVKPGDRVVAGQLLARLYEGPEAAQLERIERDFELLLVELLSNPADEGVRRSLAQLRSQRNWARSRLEEQNRRAPVDGIVGDVRVRPGQFVEAGDVLMTLNGEATDAAVIALLPGRFGPELRAGMELRLELDGYPYAQHHLLVASVSNEVLGPAAARRVLGREAAEGLPLAEPVVVVTARLESPTFRARGASHAYRDGMQGTAEVKVRSERILVALLPALRALTEGHD